MLINKYNYSNICYIQIYFLILRPHSSNRYYNNIMNIANSIKRVAKEHGMTITQVAESLGVLQPQLSRTINNPRISLEDLNKLADVIGCQVGDFFSDENNEEVTFTVGKQVKNIKIQIKEDEPNPISQ